MSKCLPVTEQQVLQRVTTSRSPKVTTGRSWVRVAFSNVGHVVRESNPSPPGLSSVGVAANGDSLGLLRGRDSPGRHVGEGPLPQQIGALLRYHRRPGSVWLRRTSFWSMCQGDTCPVVSWLQPLTSQSLQKSRSDSPVARSRHRGTECASFERPVNMPLVVVASPDYPLLGCPTRECWMTQRPGLFPPPRSTAGTSPSSAQHMARTVRRSPATGGGGVPVIRKARPVDRQRAIHRRFPVDSFTYVYTACFLGYFLYVGTASDLARRFEDHKRGDLRRDRRPDELTEMVVMSRGLGRYQALEAEQYLIGFYRSQGREVLNRRHLTVGEMKGGLVWAGFCLTEAPYPS